MTLQQLMTAITQAKIMVTILDANDVELIKFYTGGQGMLDSALLARTVTNIKIENNASIVVELASGTTNSAEGTGTDSGD